MHTSSARMLPGSMPDLRLQVLASSMKHERASVRRLVLQVAASEAFSNAALPLSCACVAAGVSR